MLYWKCSKATEHSKVRKSVPLNVKLDVIKRLDRGDRNVDMMRRALCLSTSTTRSIYLQKNKILKAAELTVRSANSKVASSGRHPITNRMKSLLLEWIDECGYLRVRHRRLRYLNGVTAVLELTQDV
ncbi:hypothetical protein M513_12032 [Trichuris suis]|uniref:HTH psq-type domain-containing protein n=1 Tax=Trichuris suis TaxID=68888 RepID=A0A085LQ76_9BILA|nr:hypothetical protein M513_12032 [Trichuris suis]